MATGWFIALEGLDGSGTTSQTRALASALRARGHTVLETREPTDGRIGRQIRALLGDHENVHDPHVIALLFAADRLEHLRNEVEPALRRGDVVLCDRYVISSWVYQSLECDGAWVRSINGQATWPDATLLLELDAKTALARVHARDPEGDRDIYETLPTQQAVADGYAKVVAEAHPGVLVIDGAARIESVTAALLAQCVELGL